MPHPDDDQDNLSGRKGINFINRYLPDIIVWINRVTLTLAILLAIVAFTEDYSTPKSNPGMYAASIAMCVALAVLASGVFVNNSTIQKLLAKDKFRSIFIPPLTLLVAYLWYADASDVHPADPVSVLGYGLAWALVALVIMFVIIFAFAISRSP